MMTIDEVCEHLSEYFKLLSERGICGADHISMCFIKHNAEDDDMHDYFDITFFNKDDCVKSYFERV